MFVPKKSWNQYVLSVCIAIAAVCVGSHTLQAATINVPTDFLSINKGLVTWWTMDGKDTVWSSQTAATVRDASGSGNTGTLTNMNRATSLASGKIGQALSFDGTDDYVRAAGLTDLTGTSRAVMSFWYNPPTWNPATVKSVAAFWSGAGSSGNKFTIELNNSANDDGCTNPGGLALILMDQTDSANFSECYAQPSPGWHHIAVVFDSLTPDFILYLDGVLQSPTDTFNNSFVAGANLGSNQIEIGDLFYQSSHIQYSPGMVDDFRIYNRALSAAEVRQLYNLGATKFNVALTDPLRNGLVGWWTMDGKDTSWSSPTAGTTRDLSGGGNTGTLTGMNRATAAAPGKVGQAMHFNPTSYIDTGNTSLGNGVSAWSWSAWIKDDVPEASKTIVGKYQATANWILYTSDADSSAMSCQVGPSETQSSQAGSHVTGQWELWTCVFDGSQTGDANRLKIYKNGVPQTLTLVSLPIPATTNTNGDTVLISDNTDYAPTASIDDVRLYSRALSAAEVRQLYAVTSGSKANVTPADPLKNGLVGWWAMDGKDTVWTSGTAGTVKDLSGNSNTGTMNSMRQTASPVPGKVGQAMTFSTDANARISVGSGASISNLTQKTISAWVYPRSFGVSGNNYGAVIESDTGSDAYYYWLMCSNDGDECGTDLNTMVFLNKTTGTYGLWQAPANTITLNQWQLLTITYDCSLISNAPKFYKNGALVSTAAVTSASGSTVCNDSGIEKSIGNGSIGGSGFDGAIDDLRIYNRILSQPEILKLYSQGR